MDIVLKIEDQAQIEELVNKGISALKPEDLHDVIVSIVSEYLRKDNYDALDKILFVEKDRWSQEPSAFTKNMIRTLDFSSMQDVADKIIDNIKEHSDDICRDLFLELLLSGLNHHSYFTDHLKQSIIDIQNRDRYN